MGVEDKITEIMYVCKCVKVLVYVMQCISTWLIDRNIGERKSVQGWVVKSVLLSLPLLESELGRLHIILYKLLSRLEFLFHVMV